MAVHDATAPVVRLQQRWQFSLGSLMLLIALSAMGLALVTQLALIGVVVMAMASAALVRTERATRACAQCGWTYRMIWIFSFLRSLAIVVLIAILSVCTVAAALSAGGLLLLCGAAPLGRFSARRLAQGMGVAGRFRAGAVSGMRCCAAINGRLLRQFLPA